MRTLHNNSHDSTPPLLKMSKSQVLVSCHRMISVMCCLTDEAASWPCPWLETEGLPEPCQVEDTRKWTHRYHFLKSFQRPEFPGLIFQSESMEQQ